VPAVIIFLTGWAMSVHNQATVTSTKIHSSFGVTLGAAGIARIVEITFVSSTYLPSSITVPFQHLPPLLLIAAGLLFMSATDEELQFVDRIGMDHVTYTLIIFSTCFLIYFFVNILLHLYHNTGRHAMRSASDVEGTDYQPLTHVDNFERDAYRMSPTVIPSGSDLEEYK